MSALKPKVVLVGPAFPLRGGIANFNEALCRSLQQEGYEVSMVSFSLQYPGFLFPGKTQFDNGKAPADLKINTMINSINPFSWFKTARYIKAKQPDLVIFRFWLPFMGPCLGTIAKAIKRGTSIKVVAITDNVIPHEARPGDKAFTSYFLKRCDAFIAMSRSVLSDLNAFVPNAPKRFLPHPIYNIFGEKLSMSEAKKQLNLDPDTRYILFFGFIRKYKGLDLLLEAMADPRLANKKLKLIVAGEFYEDPKPYMDMIEQKGLSDRLVLKTEYIPSDQVRYYFCACDIVAQPYRTATQSGVTQIAYHFEVPMLVTNVGGLPEIVPDKQVGYVTELKPQAIADALVDFYENDRYVAFAAKTAIEKKRFLWSAFVEGLIELYSGLKVQ